MVFPVPGSYGQEKAQPWLGQHCPVHGVVLVGVRAEGSRGKCRSRGADSGGPHPLGPEAGENACPVGRAILRDDLKEFRLLRSQVPAYRAAVIGIGIDSPTCCRLDGIGNSHPAIDSGQPHAVTGLEVAGHAACL